MSPRQAHPLLVPAIAASQFAGPFMVSGVAVALPALGAELNAGATALSLVETLFLAASVALLLPIGRLGDAADKVAIYKAGFLVEHWGWRAVFIVGGAVVLLLMAPIQFLLKASWHRPAPRAVHLPSTVLITAAMLALVGGAATLREGAVGWSAIALGLALVVVFVLLQRRVERPLLNVALLVQNRVLAYSLLVQWLLYCNAFGAVFLLSLYLQSVLGYGADVAGYVL